MFESSRGYQNKIACKAGVFILAWQKRDDSNMKMREREAVQSGELYGGERSKVAAGNRRTADATEGKRLGNHLGGTTVEVNKPL